MDPLSETCSSLGPGRCDVMMVSVYEEEDDVGGVVYAVLDLYCSSCIFCFSMFRSEGKK
jgi:hypothetical protein